MSGSFTVDAEEVAEQIKRVASESLSEEDLRQGVEYILKRKVIEKIKKIERVEIPYASWKPPKARYEVTLVSGARVDALYGHLIIEYEKPKTLESRSGFERLMIAENEGFRAYLGGKLVKGMRLENRILRVSSFDRLRP